jgi:hypothetical protein
MARSREYEHTLADVNEYMRLVLGTNGVNLRFSIEIRNDRPDLLILTASADDVARGEAGRGIAVRRDYLSCRKSSSQWSVVLNLLSLVMLDIENDHWQWTSVMRRNRAGLER